MRWRSLGVLLFAGLWCDAVSVYGHASALADAGSACAQYINPGTPQDVLATCSAIRIQDAVITDTLSINVTGPGRDARKGTISSATAIPINGLSDTNGYF
jgi:hypothetical protein